ncbi:MAG: hypothetical protein BroJett013_09300 [Alphaproteobacteria bacterium]|nr:MAG: hypothetical protein BroJett013_09300 [Alphaproteobacteria bacterium]
MLLPERSPTILHLKEPLLEFGHGQLSEHPKDGLFLYGPHEGPRSKVVISVGIVGTDQGIAFFREWANGLAGLVKVPPPKKTEKKDRIHLSDFPGLTAAFGIAMEPSRFVTRAISGSAIDTATRTINHVEAVSRAVDLYVHEVETHDENEEQKVDVWVFVLPELIFERCKPQSKRTGLGLVKGDFGKKQTARETLPLLESVLDQSEEAIFDDIPDFHRQVKAKLLKVGHTSQLVRETTLAPQAFVNDHGYELRRIQEPATVAWNLATGLYYKTQPRPPWRLGQVRPGVCYVGLVFKTLPNNPNHACCAAQMFLTEGDGVVFRGANGPWKTSEHEFHLKTPEAKGLIKMVVETYVEKHGSPPKELFIHGKTTFSDAEWDGFLEGAPSETNVVGVRIKETLGEVKLFRDGDYPVLRGTAMLLDDTNAYLWTNGFLPRLDTYIGPETPNPLFVTLLRSTGPMPPVQTVLADIMGLTKINYNACNFNDALPVTLRFADKVGDILTMGSAQGSKKQPFKFYV